MAKPASVIKPPLSANPAPPLSQPYRTQTFNQNHPGLANVLNQDFFAPSFQAAPSKLPDLNLPSNTFFPKNDTNLGKMTQNLPFPLPPQPLNMMNVPQNFQTNAAEKPVPYSNVPYHSTMWRNEETSQNKNWWPGQQPQRDSYHTQFDYGHNNPMSVNVGFNQQQSSVGGTFNPWTTGMRGTSLPNPSVPSYGGSNQSMTMRQVMLNETKQVVPLPVGNPMKPMGPNVSA